MKNKKNKSILPQVSHQESAGKVVLIGHTSSLALNGFLQYLSELSYQVLTQEALSADLYYYDFVIADTTQIEKSFLRHIFDLRLSQSKIVLYCETDKQLQSLIRLKQEFNTKNCKIIKSSPSSQSQEQYIRWTHLVFDEHEFYTDFSPFYTNSTTKQKFGLSLPKFSKLTKFMVLFTLLMVFLFSPFLFLGLSLAKLRPCLANHTLCTKSTLEAQENFRLANRLYQPMKSVYSLFFLGVISQNAFLLGSDIITTTSELNKLQNIKNLPLQSSSINLAELFENIGPSVLTLHSTTNSILANPLAKLDFFQKQAKFLEAFKNPLQIFSRLTPELEKSLKNKPKQTGVVFFYNNYELRPGGGFLGSFAIVEINQATITSFKIYDVYDADGQLKEHIAPPVYISEHMGQPYWFLRDSNISPDFEQNVKYASQFLEKEMKIKEVDFALGVTVQAIENLLSLTHGVYLSEFKKTIDEHNLALFVGSEVESGFFPGDQSKKNILSSVANVLMPKMLQLDPSVLAMYFSQSVLSKDLVFYARSENVQNALAQSALSGKQILPECVSTTTDCEADYLFPFESNIGVNKSNLFVDRKVIWNIDIDPQSTISHTVSIQFANSSRTENKFSGTYQNWQSFALSPTSQVSSLKVDNKEITITKNSLNNYQKVETLLTLEPLEKKTLQLQFSKTAKNPQARTFNFIIQKQIGLSYPLILQINYPKTWTLLDKNFFGLVNKQKILYNTLVNKDQIYVLEFSKLANFNK